MSDSIAVIREAIEVLSRFDIVDHDEDCLKREAIAALDQLEARYMPKLPEGWRLNSVDASIIGNFSVMLQLTGEAREVWFLYDEETNDKAGNKLYVSGTGPTINAAVKAAISAIGDQ